MLQLLPSQRAVIDMDVDVDVDIDVDDLASYMDPNKTPQREQGRLKRKANLQPESDWEERGADTEPASEAETVTGLQPRPQAGGRRLTRQVSGDHSSLYINLPRVPECHSCDRSSPK